MSAPGQSAAVGIDVGGTKLVAAALAVDGAVLDRRRQTSPVGDPDRLLAMLADMARDLGPGLPVGVGVAGIVDGDGRLVSGTNLGMEDVSMRQQLAGELGVTVAVGNDANVALWGEFQAGAAQAVRHAAMVTIGTGVGGGLVIDGELVEGAHGYAGELGHLIVDEGGRRCPCGNLGCVEAYASGTAIGAIARERLAAGGVTSSLNDEEDVDGRAVTRAALNGDAWAREILREAGTWLGVAMASIVNAVDPELIVLGGGASTHSAGFLIPAATATMRPRLLGHERREPPPVVLAELGDDAGMVGAGLLALHRSR